MRRPSRGTIALAIIALAIGLAEPSIEVAWKCRRGFESSEACVWGKSLLPLGRAVGVLLVAPVVFGVLLFIRAVWLMATARSRPPSGRNADLR
jgi:hypothetical protein